MVYSVLTQFLYKEIKKRKTPKMTGETKFGNIKYKRLVFSGIFQKSTITQCVKARQVYIKTKVNRQLFLENNERNKQDLPLFLTRWFSIFLI